MRTAFHALALCCLVLASGACASGNKPVNDNASADPQPGANKPAATAHLPPLPEGSDARAYFERGIEAYKQNYDADAVEAFEHAVRLDPDFAEAHYRLGLAYAAVGRNPDAEKSFETAVKFFKKEVDADRGDAETEFYLGLAYGKLGKYADAIKAYRRAVKESPDDTEKYYELGIAHSKLAQYREAVGALNKAIDLDPNNFRAAEALERARAGLERREDFLKQLEKQKRPKPRANTNAAAAPAPSPPSP